MATNVLELRRFDRAASRSQDGYRLPLRSRTDLMPAAEQLAREAEDLGLRMLVWHDLASLAPMTCADGHNLNTAVFGWTDADLAAWENRDRALRSPLLRAARVAAEPVLISRRGIRSSTANRLLDQIDLLDFDHCPLARAAIVVPVHMPLGQVGAAILVGIDPEGEDLSRAFGPCSGDFGDRIVRFVTAYATLWRDGRYLPEQGLLTGREIECLNWVAHGKTDYEISIILGCSHAGVRYHITRACAKLGAVNRAQSVFRAAQLGYLGTPAC
jgi:DNA-binding CsgD family transcriptional regulator